jgi:ABC-type nitrate/sulfonate/bicarbonate transport system permease component
VSAITRKALGLVSASLALLAGWWLLALAVNQPALPRPSAALVTFAADWSAIWPQILVSAGRVLVAMAIGTLLAVPIGLTLGRSSRADAVAAPLIFLTYPVPKVVFLPVLYVLLGLGNLAKITLIALIVFFQILVTARDAAKAVPEQSVLSIRSLGASRLDVYRHVIAPASMSDIFTALRIGTGTAIAVLFLAETIAGSDGIGYYIGDAWGRIDYPSMFAGILGMALLGVVLYEGLDALESWVMRWKRAGR